MGCWQLPMKNDRQDEWSLPQTLWPWWLSAIRQCLETNDVLDVHLLRGRCEAGTTTSIARRACDLVGCVRRVGSARVVGWEMRSKKKKRKKEKKRRKKKKNAGDKGSESVSFQWNVALSRRKKIRGEQEWVGWDYFAYFACYSFRRFAFVDKCFFTDYLGYAIFPDG